MHVAARCRQRLHQTWQPHYWTTSASDLATPLYVCIRPGNHTIPYHTIPTSAPYQRLHQTWQLYHTIPYHTNVCIRPGNPIVLDPLPSSVYTTFRMLCTCGRTHRQYFFYFLTVKFGNRIKGGKACGVVCVCVWVSSRPPPVRFRTHLGTEITVLKLPHKTEHEGSVNSSNGFNIVWAKARGKGVVQMVVVLRGWGRLPPLLQLGLPFKLH